jgi:hypothetical protein
MIGPGRGVAKASGMGLGQSCAGLGLGLLLYGLLFWMGGMGAGDCEAVRRDRGLDWPVQLFMALVITSDWPGESWFCAGLCLARIFQRCLPARAIWSLAGSGAEYNPIRSLHWPITEAQDALRSSHRHWNVDVLFCSLRIWSRYMSDSPSTYRFLDNPQGKYRASGGSNPVNSDTSSFSMISIRTRSAATFCRSR